MTVMFDTSVVIMAELGLPPDIAAEIPVVSAISVAELAYGIDIGDATQRDHRERRLQRVLRDLEVVPFGVEEAKIYGVLTSLVRAAGRNPRPRRLDLQIAATAAASRLPLITANPRDFAGLSRMVDMIGV